MTEKEIQKTAQAVKTTPDDFQGPHQGSTQGTQIIRVDPEQPVKFFRVSRNSF
jgi:hypothetical protein